MSYYENCLNKFKNSIKVSDINDMKLICTKTYKDGEYIVYRNNKHQLFIKDTHGIFELIPNIINMPNETFVYSHDGLHINKVTGIVKATFSVESLQLPYEYIKAGMSCEYCGIKLTVLNKDVISIQKEDYARDMKVEDNNEYIYKFMKTKIKARNGAFGFYSFMEQVAEQGKRENYPLWYNEYNKMTILFKDLCPNKLKRSKK